MNVGEGDCLLKFVQKVTDNNKQYLKIFADKEDRRVGEGIVTNISPREENLGDSLYLLFTTFNFLVFLIYKFFQYFCGFHAKSPGGFLKSSLESVSYRIRHL